MRDTVLTVVRTCYERFVSWRSFGTAFLFVSASCAREAPARPQLVVVLDTDAVVVGQLRADRELSGEATIDTIRVDVLDGRGGAIDFRDFVAPEVQDWPMSFGVAASEATAGGTVHLRIRAFRGAEAAKGVLGGTATLEPLRELAIDRAVDLTLPTEGVDVVRIVLSMGCIGVPPSFVTPARTCIDGSRRAELASAGIEHLPEIPATSQIGTWPRARAVPCRRTAATDRLCVPGGFSVMGDTALAGFEDDTHRPSVPVRPVVVSPFLIDKHEMTVGRLRALLRAGKVTTEPKPRNPADPYDSFCTWLGVDSSENDALPVNCVTVETAIEACAADGGRLPTEAEWEHAATGRGDRLLYPWGSTAASCCTASYSRRSVAGITVQCGLGSGLEPVGSHTNTGACPAVDVSRDGVVDLAGSIAEITSDRARPYDHSCWGPAGLLVDPRCEDATSSSRIIRGGDWSAGATNLLAALRAGFSVNPATGFRCVYPDEGGR